ncbi:DUF3592 domain-containing protein [Streptomyces sp. FIT100]|uniref:DUF3592 domain-containing protein n=1 Tax=Streptomyces sp. FIT100 TaxID=2837956 RepID=UPI0021C6D5C3|nr:DUF3592 domain-containing protein [Streptomyces sp. FIT100]UUN30148.1 DUF3592 domain-containing protein [Streptomyces sp. FIT100]
MGYVVFVVLGLALTGYGVHEAALLYRLRHHGIRARGLVTRYKSSSGTGGNGPTRHAVVEFVDDQGHMRQFRDQETGRGLGLQASAPVIYLPGTPGTARIDMRDGGVRQGLVWKSLSRIVPCLAVGCLFAGLALWELVRR